MQKAKDKFDRCVAAFQKASAALHEVQAELPSPFAGDNINRTSMEAAVAPRLGVAQSAWDEAKDALDQAGDELAQAIHDNREEYLAMHAEVLEEAEGRFRTHLEGLKEAAAEVAEARSAPIWLKRFSLRDAGFGEQTQYPGPRPLTIDPGDRARFMDSHTSFDTVLDMVELLVEPDPEPEPITMADAEAFTQVIAGRTKL